MKFDITKLTTDTEDGEWLQFNQTGIRDGCDDSIAGQYAEAMQEGAVFPPIIVYSDGEKYFLADGFHRVLAAEKLDWREIDAEVREGGRLEAIWFALSANKIHGIRMSRVDVRRAITRALQEFPDRSNREIARQIGCGDQLVAEVRAELEANCVIHAVEKTVGADGKLRPAKRKARLAPESIPSECPADESVAPADTPAVVIPLEAMAHDTGAAAEQPVAQETKPVGVARAQQALDLLRSIPDSDPERPQAIATISAWIRDVQTTNGGGDSGAGEVQHDLNS